MIFFGLTKLFPVPGLGEIDETDVYGTFTPKEAAALGVITASGDIESGGNSDITSKPTMTTETFDKY